MAERRGVMQFTVHRALASANDIALEISQRRVSGASAARDATPEDQRRVRSIGVQPAPHGPRLKPQNSSVASMRGLDTKGSAWAPRPVAALCV